VYISLTVNAPYSNLSPFIVDEYVKEKEWQRQTRLLRQHFSFSASLSSEDLLQSAQDHLRNFRNILCTTFTLSSDTKDETMVEIIPNLLQNTPSFPPAEIPSLVNTFTNYTSVLDFLKAYQEWQEAQERTVAERARHLQRFLLKIEDEAFEVSIRQDFREIEQREHELQVALDKGRQLQEETYFTTILLKDPQRIEKNFSEVKSVITRFSSLLKALSDKVETRAHSFFMLLNSHALKKL